MAVNKLEKEYGNMFKKVFKSINFDNGSEFSRYKDIEKKPNPRRKEPMCISPILSLHWNVVKRKR